MADNEPVSVENNSYQENGNESTVIHNDNTSNNTIADDILQQAFEEAGDVLDSSNVEYYTDNVLTVADNAANGNGNEKEMSEVLMGSDGNTYRIVTSNISNSNYNNIITPNENILVADSNGVDNAYTVTQNDFGKEVIAVNAEGIAEDVYVIEKNGDYLDSQGEQSGEQYLVPTSENLVDNCEQGNNHYVLENNANENPTESNNVSQDSPHIVNTNIIHNSSGSENIDSKTVTVMDSNVNKSNDKVLTPAPLGSSLNPIRIVQQGNQYTSLQQLSSEQLTQIMQVVQEQQVAKNAKTANGSTVLYNPQTQTRIVYKVLYPSQLHGMSDGKGRTISVNTDSVTIPIAKRTYRKRKLDDEEDRIEMPELSKAEKEEKKKKKQKTRSGRVSRPPKHMVKDYKHIHLVEWDEDYDDSDGGYSDFKMSDEEADNENSNDGSENDKTHQDNGFVYLEEKSKSNKCQFCEKSYIGERGLERHYKIHPEHKDGQPSQHDKMGTNLRSEDDCSMDVQSNPENPSPTPLISVANPSPSLAQDSKSVESSTEERRVPPPRPRGRPPGRPVRRGRGRPPVSFRGSQRANIYQQETNPARRRSHLSELVRQSSDEELMEIVLPRLVKAITLWEFLLMKAETTKPSSERILEIYEQFKELHKEVKKKCKDSLERVENEIVDAENKSSKEYLEVKEADAEVATSLDLSSGFYKVVNIQPTQPMIHYRLEPSISSSNSIKPVTTVSQSIATIDNPVHSVASNHMNGSNGIIHKTLFPPVNTPISSSQPVLKSKRNIITIATVSSSSSEIKSENLTAKDQATPLVESSAVKSSQDKVVFLNSSDSRVASLQNSKTSVGKLPVEKTVAESIDTKCVDPSNALAIQSVAVKEEESPNVQFSEDNTITAAEGELVMHDGQLMQVCGGELVPVNAVTESGEPIADLIQKEMEGSTGLLNLSNSGMDYSHADSVISDNGSDQIFPNMSSLSESFDEPGPCAVVTDNVNNSELSNSNISNSELTNATGLSNGIQADSNPIQMFQMEDGTLLIQNADGTFQVQGTAGQAIDMEAIQQAILGGLFQESPKS